MSHVDAPSSNSETNEINETFPTNSPPAPSLVELVSLDFPFSISKQTACQVKVKVNPQNSHISHLQQVGNPWKLSKNAGWQRICCKNSQQGTPPKKLTFYRCSGKPVQIIIFKTVGMGWDMLPVPSKVFHRPMFSVFVEALIFKLLFILFL